MRPKFWVAVISFIALHASPAFANWSFFMEYETKALTQKNLLSLREWALAGCSSVPAPSACFEVVTIDAAIYFDNKIIRKNNKRLLWVLFDYSQSTHDNDLSNTYYLEVDCERSSYLELTKYGYWKKMGNGNTMPRDHSKELNYPPPGSVFSKIIGKVCER